MGSKQSSDGVLSAADRRRQRRVDRAVGDLRRGLPVLLHGSGGAGLVVAAELASDSWLGEISGWGDGPLRMATTAARANVLNILPSGHPIQLFPIPNHFLARDLRDLADAAHDLDSPLRGPFDQIKDAPPDYAVAAIDLCKIGRLLPAVVVVDAKISKPKQWAARHEISALAIEDLDRYEVRQTQSLEIVVRAKLPLADAEDAQMIAFRPRDGGLEHYAVLIGDLRRQPLLVRLHSECFTGDLLRSLKCDCGDQLRGAVKQISASGGGVLLYLAQEGRGIGLLNELRAYSLQDQGFDTLEANRRLGFDADERVFAPAGEMLRLLNIHDVRLLTNNPEKVSGLEDCGIRVVERVPHKFPSNGHNDFYLRTKRQSGHYL